MSTISVVCNQVFEHIKNIYTPLSEIRRVLKKDGLLCLSVPNLPSIHCRILLGIGEQPSTIRTMGAHVRGFTFKEIKRFVEYNNLFQVTDCKGVGLIPFFTNSVPAFLNGISHTTLLFSQKTNSKEIDWRKKMTNSGVSTNY